MFDKDKLSASLMANLKWIEQSGVLAPTNGTWGIAARLVLTENNQVLEYIKKSFPAYTEHGDYIIIEHRRPDCNFEAALLFLQVAEMMNDNKYYQIADNILCYLFCRSGMYNTRYDKFPKNVWRWANEKWVPKIWFDDNSWNCVISLLIAERYPELGKKYGMKNKALLLANQLLKSFNMQFEHEPDDSWQWEGALKFPHWGSMVAMALSYAYRETGDEEYREVVVRYHQYLMADKINFSASDQAYAVIGATAAATILKDDDIEQCARKYADSLLKKMDKLTGAIPSEHAKEAPVGSHLVDMIYTQNWTIVGLQMIHYLTGEEKYLQGLNKSLNLIIDIQDKSPQKYLNGCWRGMYDLQERNWGGGNLYEGGANSIYTGWTNIPISLIIVFILTEKSLLPGKAAAVSK
jgi:hypothetical protein